MRSSNENRSHQRRRSGDRLLRSAVRGAGWWLVPLVVVAVLDAAATLALPALLGRAVDQLVTTTARSGAPTWSTAGGTLAATAAVVLFLVVVDVVTQLVGGWGTARTTARLRTDLARHVLAAGPSLAPATAEGDLVTRLVSGTATAARAVVILGGLAAAVLPPAGAVVALALVDPWLAATFVVGMASVSGVVRTYLRRAHEASSGYLEAQGAIAARLVDALAGARTIAAARTTDVEVERVLAPIGELRRQGRAVWQNIARLAVRGEPAVLLTQVAVVAVAGARLSAGHLTPGELLAAGRYAVLAAGIGSILDELGALTRARAAAERVAEVLAAPALTYGTAPLPAGPGRLELRHVTAGEAGPDGAPVLDDLELDVPGGKVVALVGRSGAGKSLVAALAGRLCDPAVGTVLLDGVPLRDLDRVTLRRAVGYAFERPGLLQGTVAEAIRFGVDVPPPDRVRDASRAARAFRFIARLPEGYASLLAETPLSGGEVQRLGLARALAHDARVLILDDATSSLDTATEAEIAVSVTTHLQGRTRLVVTHRRATAARADLVAWLDGGRIRACAPHRDLWAYPEYRALFRPDPVPAPDAIPVTTPA
ncbi:MAG TPA: ABC transporter ATP-binding protein, partial [Acidimicrobiales bacterium]